MTTRKLKSACVHVGKLVALQTVYALTLLLGTPFETYTKRLQGSTVTPEGTVPVGSPSVDDVGTSVSTPVEATE